MSKYLIGKKAFREHLANSGDAQLDTFMSMGMPVLIHNGKWYGHSDNIDEWFKAKTRKQVRVGQEKDQE